MRKTSKYILKCLFLSAKNKTNKKNYLQSCNHLSNCTHSALVINWCFQISKTHNFSWCIQIKIIFYEKWVDINQVHFSEESFLYTSGLAFSFPFVLLRSTWLKLCLLLSIISPMKCKDFLNFSHESLNYTTFISTTKVQ